MVFIVNPISGNGRKAKIIKLLRKTGQKLELTSHPGHAEQLARESDDDVVVAVGGDGTVNEVARGLLGSGKTLGILPCGSGDGLALDLGISRRPHKALKSLLGGRAMPLDAGFVNGKAFFSVCGVGFDARVSKMFAESGKRGVWNYIFQALKLWHGFVPEHYVLEIDGESLEMDAVLITIGNSNQWGNGARVTPLADVSDGILEITVLDMFRTIELPSLALKLMTGRCYRSRRVHHYRGRHIVIRRASPGPAHFDGECFDAPETLDISILPGALKVIAPRKSKSSSRGRGFRRWVT